MRHAPLKIGGLLLLFVVGVVLRALSLGAESGDMYWYLLPWYGVLKAQGAAALGTNFSNYTPPYLYFLWLATLTSRFLPPITAIKLISIAADLLNCVLVVRLVRLKYPVGLTAWLAGALFWCLPTVMLNSSLWGQADGLYTGCLIGCLYFLLTDRPLLGMCAFGAAFAFKAQAVFLAPLLAVLLFKRRLAWHYLLVVPAIYLVACLPAALLGRPWGEIFGIYLSQAATYPQLSMNAPNLYIFMTRLPLDPAVTIGLAAAVIGVSGWVWFNARARSEIDRSMLLLMALVSVALVPFLLPKMHDRYFYPADVLSLLAAFYAPELWIVPVVYQVISTLAYLSFLFIISAFWIQLAAVLNTLAVAFLLWRQVSLRAGPGPVPGSQMEPEKH